MGIEWNTAKFLLTCRGSVAFTRTLTLGRQCLFVSQDALRSLVQQSGFMPTDADNVFLKKSDNFGYAEGLFELLGAREVTSLDCSDFEGASVIHDLNEPLPTTYREQYDLVYDGGTLEHVFNFPRALRSAMEAVRIGGHILLHTPTNNYCGHGFYQLSPELFYRALSQENGFQVERMIAFFPFEGSRWYDVEDPAKAGCRVEIARASHRVLLLVLGRRIHRVEIFRNVPQQSDYVAGWNSAGSEEIEVERRFFARWRNAWNDGRLWHGLVRRCVSFTRSNAWADAWANRRLSVSSQPTVFRALDCSVEAALRDRRYTVSRDQRA
jgi:SAM-dependent methyltransferase